MGARAAAARSDRGQPAPAVVAGAGALSVDYFFTNTVLALITPVTEL